MGFKELIRLAHPYLDRFDRENYPECFEKFEALAADLFTDLPTAAEALNELSYDYDRYSRREQKELSFNDKRVLALFLTPAALRAGTGAKIFAQQLCALWNARYPRNRYYVGDYAAIMKGFDSNLLGMLRKVL